MLSSIGRAAIRRAGAGGQSTNGALWRMSYVNSNQKAARNQIQSFLSIDRAYATATATTTVTKKSTTTKSPAKATNSRTPATTTKAKASARKPATTTVKKTTKTSSAKPAKKPAAKPKKTAVSQAKPRRAGLTDKQKEKVALAKIRAKERAIAQKEKAIAQKKLFTAKEKQKARESIQKQKAALKLAAEKEKQKARDARLKEKAAEKAAEPKVVIRELKKVALEFPPNKVINPYSLYVQQTLKGDKQVKIVAGAENSTKQVAASYAKLSAGEKEALRSTVDRNAADNKIAYTKFVEQHTPDQIREANLARRKLRNLTGRKGMWRAIEDARHPKHPKSAYIHFITEQSEKLGKVSEGMIEHTRSLAAKWKALPEAEQKPYYDAFQAEHDRYVQEYKTVYHRDSTAA